MPPKKRANSKSSQVINLGFVPLCDSAPIIIAKEKGFFEAHNLKVKLSREPGWASIRDKLSYGELDAAEAILGLVFALHLGLGCLAREVMTPLILSANGNAITMGNHIPKEIIAKDDGLQTFLKNDFKNDRPFTLAAVHPFSCHNFLLHSWLRRQNVIPGEHIEIVFLPPTILSRNLDAGTIDGFCVGDPWNSKTILEQKGWCAATSRDIYNGHPEKALLCSESFSQNRTEEMLNLTAALYQSCLYCSDPNNSQELVTILSKSRYLNTKKDYISNIFERNFETGHGTIKSNDLLLFSGNDVNAPSSTKASWILSSMRQTHIISNSTSIKNIGDIFRTDLFEEATKEIA